MPSSPEKRKEQRKIAYERHKMRMATDPAYADTYRAKRVVIERNKRKKTAKETVTPLQAPTLPAWRLKRPGRIVASCGWNGW